MKIIKHGKYANLFRGVCDACGCLVECNRSEIDYQKNDPDMPFRFVCPECKELIKVRKI